MCMIIGSIIMWAGAFDSPSSAWNANTNRVIAGYSVEWRRMVARGQFSVNTVNNT